MLANQEVYGSVADRFNVLLSTAWEYFQRVVNVLMEVSSIYIKWPESYENITRKFMKRGGIDGVIGAIDGTHIPITTPSYMSNKYLNRKQYHSIVLQGVCDASYIFTDCFAGCPGSVHDARVYRMSPLFKQIMPNITGDYHLLGDSAYPNATNLITPYRDNGHLTRQQRHFNYLHSATRVHIEQSFGLLKGRFRILKFVNIYKTETIPNNIIACCVLHNICMQNKESDINLDELDSGRIIDEIVTEDSASYNKRDTICRQIAT
ncbi:putative nuclease HARBI1 [Coccinella septempunctata]|uniref:putative nuclease HARBI1 n=1 Tax=Coccinella septempunctata TaxID=41139 RepID=UPI001D098806|nr:putative nuclease HARBI1 [Coccinella septempunctata]